SDEVYNGLVMGTDVAFWKIFQFRFLAGKPYTEEEFTSGIRKAVVSESLARRLFNTSDATGKTFL
ncbi:MAG TPA: ABC transporter permease, partial [Parabacteroides goldsteinii]|nr:ABC transporter permease [Parabacteroides goldsteinii]